MSLRLLGCGIKERVRTGVAQVQHKERFLAEANFALREVPAVLEHDGVRLAFDLDEEAQIGRERPRYEERDLVWRGKLGLSFAR